MITQEHTLIFDCDGVLADTERYGHLPAFNRAFTDLGVPLHWSDDDYATLVTIGGGKERIAAALAAAPPAAPSREGESEYDLVTRIHKTKTSLYRDLISRGTVPPRPGAARLIRSALASGWQVAVASTSAPESVKSVLDSVVGSDVAARIPIFAGDSVPAKKPAPDIYLLAVDQLQAEPRTTIVVEDSAIGLRAAAAAGLTCIVTPSSYTAGEDFSLAAAVVTSLGDTGEPTTVIANPNRVDFGDAVDLESLQRLAASHPSPVSRSREYQ